MNKEWSLEKLYKGYDDPRFAADEAKLDQLLKDYAEFAAHLEGDPKAVLKQAVTLNQELSAVTDSLTSFAYLKQSVNTSDTASAAAIGRIFRKLSALAAPRTALVQYIAGLDDLQSVIDSDELLKEKK